MGFRWLSKMIYVQQSRHGLWKYRRSIPQHLRAAAGKAEINVSLGTRDEQLAELRYVKVHGDTEVYLGELAKRAASPTRANSNNELAELGRAYMRQLKLPYVPLTVLWANAEIGPRVSEYDKRLDLVEELGIEVDDAETRDEKIEASLEARVLLGT